MKNTEKGVALIMTLWALVLLSVIAMNFTFSTRGGSASTRNFKEETIAYYSALSAYEDAVNYLVLDKDPAVDIVDKDGIFRSDSERPPVSGQRLYDNITVDIKVIDEDSKVNINFLNKDLLRRLFSSAGIADDAVSELIDSLTDWKDPDSLHHLSGAETEYYNSLEMPYNAKNKPLDLPEELLLIKGFKPEYIYGSEDIKPLYPIITTYSTAVNINTAPREVLELAGLSEKDIENIMKLREAEEGGMRVVPVIKGGIPFTTSSSNFRIELTAHIPDSNLTVKITSVVKRDGTEIKTIYWKEGIESSRS